ncbi:hypothetical protein I4F81_007780 [Pyropia yezoensis]|uniref:Uncharacterized protein n=1 Tax=Pyropia yezoensis TaxID=2788 RepID=A0ACC3C4P2_PYRYE|nr:hypothetical protein I4F81_007780 [Neopyropia yezoensis]
MLLHAAMVASSAMATTAVAATGRGGGGGCDGEEESGGGHRHAGRPDESRQQAWVGHGGELRMTATVATRVPPPEGAGLGDERREACGRGRQSRVRLCDPRPPQQPSFVGRAVARPPAAD